MLTIHMLPALYGDTILIDITTGGEKPVNTNILVDCGYNFSSQLLPLLQSYHRDGKVIDRFIITHYDDDHIRSAAKFIKENGQASEPQIIKISQVWLNAYRHLQFEKRKLPPPDDTQIALLNNFITIHNPDKGEKESEIGAKQASKLGRELLSGNYCWNEDFRNEAVCIESNKVINITNDVRIKLLSPDKKQLTALDDEFKTGLKEMGVSISDTELIDDAFELYSRSSSKEDINGKTGTIRGSATSTITSDAINWWTNKAKYKADQAPGNGSSIAFILEAEGKKILMLADAHAERVIEQLKTFFPNETPLYFDAIKVAHHGSLANNPKELYELVDSPLYLISTNGDHPSHVHPDIETLAFIVNRPLRGQVTERKLVFNYYPTHLPGFFDQKLMDQFHYTAVVSNKIELK